MSTIWYHQHLREWLACEHVFFVSSRVRQSMLKWPPSRLMPVKVQRPGIYSIGSCLTTTLRIRSTSRSIHSLEWSQSIDHLTGKSNSSIRCVKYQSGSGIGLLGKVLFWCEISFDLGRGYVCKEDLDLDMIKGVGNKTGAAFIQIKIVPWFCLQALEKHVRNHQIK